MPQAYAKYYFCRLTASTLKFYRFGCVRSRVAGPIPTDGSNVVAMPVQTRRLVL